MSEKRSDTAEALMEAAEKLFSERGYVAVSTRDLAEAAGVNLAAIQYHFGSKAKLFIEVVHQLMEKGSCAQARLARAEPPKDKEEAALMLGQFIFGFLEYLIAPQEAQPYRIMVREVFTDHSEDPEMVEALIASVVDKFMGPTELSLLSWLRVLAPHLSSDDLPRAARCITGQCAFYASHRPFLERFPGPDSYSVAGRRALKAFIFTFSLTALGCDPAFIDKAIARVVEESRSCTEGK